MEDSRILDVLINGLVDNLKIQSDKIKETNITVVEIRKIVDKSEDLIRTLKTDADKVQQLVLMNDTLSKKLEDSVNNLHNIQLSYSELNSKMQTIEKIFETVINDLNENKKKINSIYLLCEKLKSPTALITGLITVIGAIAGAVIAIFKAVTQ